MLLPPLLCQALLDEVMEEFFFGDGSDWELAPPPCTLRPVVLDLLHALVQVQVRQLCPLGGRGLLGGQRWAPGKGWHLNCPVGVA